MNLPSLCIFGLFLCGCAVTAPQEQAASASEMDALRARVKKLEEENTLLNLKLQDEIERGTIQVFLTRQEVAVAKREAAALRTKCGAPCAEAPRQ